MRKKMIPVIVLFMIFCGLFGGCEKRQDAYNNEKMSQTNSNLQGDEENTFGEELQPDEGENSDKINPAAVIKENSTYDCDLQADREAYDGHVDITVGDNYYATQINDWYMHFDEYEGKVIEIEGYYIGDFKPYDFVGRYGPSCPYCQGGYVSFELLTDEDVTELQSGKDWIKVTGILRQGTDSLQEGPFYYIEALKLEKMEEVGKDTISN